MKKGVWFLLAAVLLSVCFTVSTSAQSGTVYWREDFNYASADQMASAGWTLYKNPAGISVGGGGVTLNGKNGDAVIYIRDIFPSGIYDWKIESKSMWLGEGYSGSGVNIVTEKHSYGFAADGYYNEFAFYRDNKKILHFGIYQESINSWMTIAMVKQSKTISMYFNGELKNTYEELDASSSAAIGVDIISPWRGDAKYDYYLLSTPNYEAQNASPQEATSSFPLSTVLIVGGLAAVVVAGVVVYYFFIAGGSGASTGASVGAGAASTGTDSPGDGGEAGGGTLIHNDVPSPEEVGNLICHFPPEAKDGLEDGEGSGGDGGSEGESGSGHSVSEEEH